MAPLTIGVLDLQGAVAPHCAMLQSLGVRTAQVRSVADLAQVDALVLPGGESTTLRKLLQRFQLDTPIARRIAGGMPTLGTCAGLILLARQVIGGQPSPLASIDITAHRNAYGRQTESFEAKLSIVGVGEDVPAVFIRAPQIAHVGAGVEVLARFGTQPVAARQGHVWVAAFHPELTADNRFHAHFVASVRDAQPEAGA